MLGALFYAWIMHGYYADVPQPTRNYSAELNEPLLRIPETDRAWTHYRRIVSAMEPIPENWGNNFAVPGSDLWPEVCAYLSRNERTLEELCATARMPTLGYLLTDGLTLEESALVGQQLEHPPSENPSLASTKILGCKLCRRLSWLLTADAYLAETNKDGARIHRDLMAILGMCEQIKEHGMSAADLFSLVLFRQAMFTLGAILYDSPDVFTDAQLEQFQRTLSQTSDAQLGVDLVGDWLMIEDHVQRCYTSDGLLHYPSAGFDLAGWERIMAPIYARRAPTASGMLTLARKRLQEDRVHINSPLWQRSGSTHVEMIKTLAELRDYAALLAYPVDTIEALDFTVEHARQYRDSSIVALAIERFRRIHGRCPAELAELCPNFLKVVPPDRFSGKPICYIVSDDQPGLYSVGFDRDDDAGATSEDNPSYVEFSRFSSLMVDSESAEDGDWILWPIAKPTITPTDSLDTNLESAGTPQTAPQPE